MTTEKPCRPPDAGYRKMGKRCIGKSGKLNIFLPPMIDYPLFSFKHLQKVSFDGDVKAKFFQDFLLRLKKYSDLGWKQMATEKRHDYGWEYLPQDRMKNKLPAAVTPEVQLMVLRSANDKRAMVGFREWNIYHVIFIEAVFNEIYEHGK